MSYVEKNLMKDEEIVYKGELHWLIVAIPMFVSIVGVIITLSSVGKIEVPFTERPLNLGLFVLLMGLGFMLRTLIFYISTEFAITNERVIAKFGLIRRQTSEMNHNKVESLNISQGILGRIFNFGTIRIHGTGSGMSAIPHVKEPLSFRRAEYEAIAKTKGEMRGSQENKSNKRENGHDV